MATVHAALRNGINWVDTAAVYGFGHAEDVVGRALRDWDGEVFIATKCGLRWDDNGNINPDLRAPSVREECDASLRRLGVDVIDLYQLHWPNPDEQIEEGWDAMAELIRAGKVRYGGVSNFSVDQMKRAQAIHPITSLQPPYSMLDRGVEKGELDYCAEQEIGVIAYSPLQKGFLTGKVTAAWVAGLPEDDHRKAKDPMFQEPELSEVLKRVEQLEGVAGDLELPLSHLAIAWVLRRREMTAAIVGARRPGQIEETAPAMDVTLPAESLDAIERILA